MESFFFERVRGRVALSKLRLPAGDAPAPVSVIVASRAKMRGVRELRVPTKLRLGKAKEFIATVDVSVSNAVTLLVSGLSDAFITTHSPIFPNLREIYDNEV